MRTLLPHNITVLALDFTGSGLSEGEYVSLGWYEKDDLETVIEYLRSTGKVSLIGLWGRSMGAATSLFHGARDPSIAAMVLDSPFVSLQQLSEELCKQYSKVPLFVARFIFRFLRKTIKKKAQFDISRIRPIEAAEKCYIPALFVVAKSDDFVRPLHGEKLFKVYPGDKNIVRVEGDHNSDRPSFMFDSVSIFFHTLLGCDNLPKFEEEKLPILEHKGYQFNLD